MNLKNKARLMLGSIAIFAAIGGAFALKTARTEVYVYTRTTTATTHCYGTVPLATTTNRGLGTIKTTYATLVYGAACPLTKTIYIAD